MSSIRQLIFFSVLLATFRLICGLCSFAMTDEQLYHSCEYTVPEDHCIALNQQADTEQACITNEACNGIDNIHRVPGCLHLEMLIFGSFKSQEYYLLVNNDFAFKLSSCSGIAESKRSYSFHSGIAPTDIPVDGKYLCLMPRNVTSNGLVTTSYTTLTATYGSTILSSTPTIASSIALNNTSSNTENTTTQDVTPVSVQVSSHSPTELSSVYTSSNTTADGTTSVEGTTKNTPSIKSTSEITSSLTTSRDTRQVNPTTDQAKATNTIRTVARTDASTATISTIPEGIENTLENLNLLEEVEVGNVVDVIRSIDRSFQSLVNSTNTTVAFRKNNVEIVVLRKSVQDGFQEETVLSQSQVLAVGLADTDIAEKAAIVLAQFTAPQIALQSLVQDENPDSSLNTKKTTNFFTGSSPVLAISAYDAIDAREVNARVKYSINVSMDRIPVMDESTIVTNITYMCNYINLTTGLFSDKGCQNRAYQVAAMVTCKCKHTTMFAVLISVTTVRIPKGVKIASYSAEGLSVLCLLTTVLILTKVRKHFRSDRLVIQISLSASLLLLHIITLLHDIAIINEITCIGLAIFTHYFLLTTAMWMLMEGVTVVFKTSDKVLRYNEKARSLNILRHVVCWGIPIIIVVTSAVIGLLNETYMEINPQYIENKARGFPSSSYRKYNWCWLNSSSLILLWSVVTPISTILFLNVLVILRISYVVYLMKANKQKLKPSFERRKKLNSIILSNAKSSLKIAILFLPVLGIPWILGFFVGVDDRFASVVFMYINVILNGSQGLFIFIIYCIVGRDVRTTALRIWNRETYTTQSLKSSVASTVMSPPKGIIRMQMKHSDITLKKVSRSNDSEESTTDGLKEITVDQELNTKL